MDFSLLLAIAGGIALAFLPEWVGFVLVVVKFITGFMLARVQA